MWMLAALSCTLDTHTHHQRGRRTLCTRRTMSEVSDDESDEWEPPKTRKSVFEDSDEFDVNDEDVVDAADGDTNEVPIKLSMDSRMVVRSGATARKRATGQLTTDEMRKLLCRHITKSTNRSVRRLYMFAFTTRFHRSHTQPLPEVAADRAASDVVQEVATTLARSATRKADYRLDLIKILKTMKSNDCYSTTPMANGKWKIVSLHLRQLAGMSLQNPSKIADVSTLLSRLCESAILLWNEDVATLGLEAAREAAVVNETPNLAKVGTTSKPSWGNHLRGVGVEGNESGRQYLDRTVTLFLSTFEAVDSGEPVT